MTSINAEYTVTSGDTLVEEHIVDAKKHEEALILTHLALEEQLRLGLHGLAEIVVELREDVRVGFLRRNIAHAEPLPDEVIHPPLRLRVGHHAPYLLGTYGRTGQSALCRVV